MFAIAVESSQPPTPTPKALGLKSTQGSWFASYSFTSKDVSAGKPTSSGADVSAGKPKAWNHSHNQDDDYDDDGGNAGMHAYTLLLVLVLVWVLVRKVVSVNVVNVGPW